MRLSRPKFIEKLHAKYPFHPLVWYIIVETALSRMAFFMAMPFVALRMHDASGAGLSSIGAIIGVAPLMSTLAGFYVGHWSDKFGRRRIIIATLYIWSAILLGFSLATRPLEFAILMGLNGLARGVFEPVTTALISDLCAANKARENLQKHAFHLRYFAINIGSSVGPLVGATILVKSPTLGFQMAAAVWFLSATLFLQLSRHWNVKAFEKTLEKATHSLATAFKVFARDRALRIYLMAFFLMSFSYSQIESIFAIHLKDLYGNDGVMLYGRLLTLNGITVVLLTLPLLSWAKKYDLNKICAASALFFCLGYLLMGLSSQPLQYYLSMIVLTVGEIVIFANGNMMIENLAPPKMKGAYLGLSNISSVGFVIGPAIGGALLEKGGGMLLFSVLSVLMLVVSALYLLARRFVR
jgi:MFS family permease